MPVMRRISCRRLFFLALLCAIAAPLLAEGRADEPLYTVKGVVGDVKVRINPAHRKVRREMAAPPGKAAGKAFGGITGEWADLRLGMTVGEFCEIMTAAESEAVLETGGGIVVKIEENTRVEVAMMRLMSEKARGGKPAAITGINIRMKIAEGGIIASVKRLLNDKLDVRFETPTAVAAIRGTVVEIESVNGGSTVIRAFDGTVHVAALKGKRFTELKDGQMAEVAPKRKIVSIRPVPADYVRKSMYLRGEESVEESRLKIDGAEEDGYAAQDGATDALSLTLGGAPDTINCHAGDTITVEGAVSPPGAKVSVNGLEAAVDENGAFRLSFQAPGASGAFALNITAENGAFTETVVRMLNVRARDEDTGQNNEQEE